jgi:hypothetical protein
METLHECVQFCKLGGGFTHLSMLSVAVFLRAVDTSVQRQLVLAVLAEGGKFVANDGQGCGDGRARRGLGREPHGSEGFVAVCEGVLLSHKRVDAGLEGVGRRGRWRNGRWRRRRSRASSIHGGCCARRRGGLRQKEASPPNHR